MVFVTKYSPGSVPPAPWASDPSPGVLDSATQWPFQLISDLTAKLVGADFTFDAQSDPTNGTSTDFRISPGKPHHASPLDGTAIVR